jgi:hypothetical protein
MPNWKKVIVSGSDASLNSITTPAGTINNITASNAITASYALNGGVTQLLAGPNITLSPTNGLGQVTVTATLSGSNSYNTATGSYGSFYDTTTQTNPVANIARSMSFNSTDITNGVSISGSTSPFNTYIKTENAGIYNIQFSAQVDKTDGGTDDIVIWLRKNGIDLTDTATTLTLPTNNSKVVAAWNWFVSSATGDYYQIIWRSDDTDLRLLAEPISINHPGIPSVILTVNRVDQFLSNTGSFSGSFTGTLTGTASYATQALTASYVNPLNQTVEITGSLQVQDSIDSSLRFLFDSTGTASLDWEDGYLYNGLGSISADWKDRKLYDSNVDNSVNWNTRQLFKSDGTTVTLDWETGVFTGSMLGTASYAAQALTASYTPAVAGTDNYIPKFNGSSALENSVMYETGSNIGIGTTTPGFKLDVIGDSATRGTEYIFQSVNSTTGYLYFDHSGTQVWKQGVFSDNISTFSIGNDGGFNRLFNITNNGNVGIGTTSPGGRLDVVDTLNNGTYGAVNITNNVPNLSFGHGLIVNVPNFGVGWGGNTNYSLAKFTDAGGDAAWIGSAQSYFRGNVGIGTTSPAYKLDVIGKIALNDGGNSVLIGTNAGLLDNGTNNSNVAVGVSASQNNTNGTNNVAIGINALFANTVSNNTAIGTNALSLNTTGTPNTAVGSFSQVSSSTGTFNTSLGTNTLSNNTIGSLHTALGASVLFSLLTGSSNSAVGSAALFSLITGSENNALGRNAGRYYGATGTLVNTDASASIFIGFNSRANNIGQTNQIVIGNEALGLGSNTVVLGNDNITTTALKGNIGIGTTTPNAKLDVNGNAIITGSLTVTGGITGSITSASFALTASNITPAISNDADTRILTANGNGTLNGEGNLTFDGNTLKLLYQSGDEGGEMLLSKPVTNTTIAGTGVTVDIYQNRLRFFEQGGTARGFYLDITTGGAGVATNLASGGGTVTSIDTAGSVNGITLTGGPITGAGTITLGGTLSGITPSQLATSSIMIGSTNITLGATASSLTGLTSINATSFTGSLRGTASNAVDSQTAINASQADTISITNTTTGTGPYYPLFVDTTAGFALARVDNSGLSYNATTNLLSTTASYANQALSSSFTTTASYVLNAVSSSFTSTASFVNPLVQNVVITGSLTVTGSQIISGSLTTTGNITSGNNLIVSGSTITLGAGLVQPNYLVLNSSIIDVAVGGSYISRFTRNGYQGFIVANGATIGFSSVGVGGSPMGNSDVAFSRISSNVMALGNGTNGNSSGTLIASTFSGSFLNLTGSATITGSLIATQNVTASRAFLSASNGTTNGPTLTVYGSGSAQPVLTVQGSQGELFSITDSLSGSLYSVNDISGLPILEVFSDNTVLIGNYQDPMLITTTKLVTTASGAFTLYSLPTSSYDTAFFEYSIKSGSNARAGTIMAIQLGSSVNFTETTTTDFGLTSGFGFTVQVAGANMILTGSATTSGWTIKTIVRGI